MSLTIAPGLRTLTAAFRTARRTGTAYRRSWPVHGRTRPAPPGLRISFPPPDKTKEQRCFTGVPLFDWERISYHICKRKSQEGHPSRRGITSPVCNNSADRDVFLLTPSGRRSRSTAFRQPTLVIFEHSMSQSNHKEEFRFLRISRRKCSGINLYRILGERLAGDRTLTPPSPEERGRARDGRGLADR